MHTYTQILNGKITMDFIKDFACHEKKTGSKGEVQFYIMKTCISLWNCFPKDKKHFLDNIKVSSFHSGKL